MNTFKTIFFMALLFACTSALPHGGRTDASGGHNNRKTGGYHYHNGGRSYNSYKKQSVSKPKKSTKVLFIQSGLKLLGYYSIGPAVTSAE